MTLAAVVQAPEAELAAHVLEDRRVGRALVVGGVDGALVKVVESRAALVCDAVANPPRSTHSEVRISVIVNAWIG